MAEAWIDLWIVRRARAAKMKEVKVTRRIIRDMNNPFELHESQFRKLYRISREMARDICIELEEDLAPKKTFGISVQIKVLVAVRFLAEGGYQRGTGQDYLLVVGQTTVSKVIRQFLDTFLPKFFRKWVQFPGTHASRTRISQGFEEKIQFPNVVGCIDCTHVAISAPHEHPESYLNHHNFHSINVQLICDVDGKILNVNAKYPGRTHDQFIFNFSVVKKEMMRLYTNRIGDFHLIGDSGYALEPWMITPITHAELGSPEDHFTKMLCSVRNIIERVNGVLKATFRAVKKERVLRYEPETASKIIHAATVLYNMMKHYRMPLPLPEPDAHDIQPERLQPIPDGVRLLNIAREKRQRLVRQLQL